MLVYSFFSFYLIFLSLSLLFFKKSKLDFIVYIFIFFGLIWQSVSFFYLSNGGWSSELNFYGSFSFIATLTLLFFILISVFILKISKIISKFVQKRKHYSSSFYQNFVVLFFFILVLVGLFINGFLYGFPLIELMHRFTYWSQVPFDLRNFFGYLYILSFFAGYFYKDNKVYVFLILASVLLSILYSNKFTVIFYMIVYFLMGKYLASDSKFSKNQLLFFIFTVFILLGLFFLIIFNKNDMLGTFFLERALGNQGHFLYLSLTNEFMKYDFIKVVSNNVSEFFMYRFGDAEFVKGILEKGFRFSGLYPALIFFTFSFFPLLFYVISLFSVYFVLFMLKNAIDKGMIFTPILFVKLFAYFQVFNSGNWQDIFLNHIFYLTLFLLVILYSMEYFLLKFYRKKNYG